MKLTRPMICLLLLASTYVNAQTITPFKSNDKIAFVGNSITHAGFYQSYIWLYYMTHFPNEKITLLNAGSGGDVAGQMLDRLQGDVFNRNPNIVALTFGMNDSGYLEFYKEADKKLAVEKSYKSFQSIIEKLKEKSQIKKIIMTSSPYDETVKVVGNLYRGKAATLEKITDLQRAEAKKQNWGLVDFYTRMWEMNIKGQKTDSTFTIIGNDRIHPGNGGNLIMAYLFLKAQGLANNKVADVVIDFGNKTVEKVVNAKVNQLSFDDKGFFFEYLANSLPFPIDSVSRIWGNNQTQVDALKVIPFTKEFNEELLTVRGLGDKYYQLIIDETNIGTFAGKDFNDGINLALLSNTPQYKQSINIMYLNMLRKDIEDKLREYYWLQFNYFKNHNLLFKDDQNALDAVRKEFAKIAYLKSKVDVYETTRYEDIRRMLQQNMNHIIDKIYKENKPKIHLIKIVPL